MTETHQEANDIATAQEEAGAQEPEAPAPAIENDLAEARAESARLRDQLLRTAADFDNFRKRSRRDVDDALRRGRESVVKDLLPVFDNFERAILHTDNSPDLKSVAEGLRIVLKQFLDTLEKLGIQRVSSTGQPFDPAVHEAIQHMHSTEHPAGVVVAEVQPGYKMGEYLVRPAMVVVSRGPASGEQAASE